MKKLFLILLVGLSLASCKKESTSSTTTTTTGTTTSDTWVKLTAINAAGEGQPNYIIMMFDQPVTSSSALPPILKQVTTDANGLAYFDLNSMITSSTPKRYYFEAFIKSGSDYVWKSVTNYSKDIAKGTMATSSIIVN